MTHTGATGGSSSDVDFMQELRREQVGFRLYGVLFALLFIAIAVVMGISTFLTVQRLDQLDSTLAAVNTESREARIGNVRLYIELGALKNAQEARNTRDVRDGQELAATRRLTASSDPSQAANLPTVAGVRLATAHITETPVPYDMSDPGSERYNGRLNWATVSLIRILLTARTPDGALRVQGAERLVMEAAVADWQELDRASRDALYERLSQVDDPELAAVGFVGRARIAYERAEANEDAPWAWNAGCEEAVRHADAATAVLTNSDSGADAAAAFFMKGACLRKNGLTARAHEAFSRALDVVAPNRQPAYPESSAILYEAFHGVGTTLIALANLSEAERGEAIAWPDNPAAEARALIEQAAALRVAWGMTAVGEVGSLENEGFIFLTEGDLEGALRHTEEIDNVVPLAWNLTCRLAAASELLAASGGEDQRYQALVDETLLKLSLIPRGDFDEPELRRLTPTAFHKHVDTALAVSEREPEDVFDDMIAIALSRSTNS